MICWHARDNLLADHGHNPLSGWPDGKWVDAAAVMKLKQCEG